MKQSVKVFYAFARSGGTLTNQLLACCPEVVIACEVGVNESAISFGHQLRQWHQLISADEVAAFDCLPYLEQVKMASALVEKQGKVLCVRDWPVVNFLPGLRPGQVPSRILESWEYLHSAGWGVTGIAIIRRSYEVYLSMRKYLVQCTALEEEEFCTCYEAYLKEINRTGMPKFFLEDIRSEPLQSTQSMARTLGLIEPASIDGFHQYQACTGNNTLASKPESARLNMVKKAEKPVPAPPLFQELDRLASYE
ncbi:hypothetical protein [Verrucomicrobium sp. BvORR034]|uniref:hypothetical protein n=1 Tax=Verrucomicrobium sp. BvORR034 TaxID=1396418 RepID=UPI00067848F3|nr:hypothetical protein [Verrucomicrobium sp. BvORR034]